jgi:uncharacterized membrane protein YqjE
MVAKARRAREAFRLIRIHAPAYLRVFHCDLNALRRALVRPLAGLIISAVAGLLFVSFLSVAILISAWDTPLRLITAWGVVAVWLVIAIAGLIYARSALRSPVPLATLTPLLQRDLAAIERDAP